MKILLVAINAKYIHSNLGVYSLKAYADREAGGEDSSVEISEYTINHEMDRILQDIYKRKPEVVGFSCYIWNIRYVSWLAKDLAKVLPRTQIWLGGPEVSYDAKQSLERWPWIRGIMTGEGEETFSELVRFYEGGQLCLEDIRGIVFRRDSGHIAAAAPRPLLDMDRIPFCYGSLEGMEHRILYYESSRGCPYSCSYCLSSIDKSVRFRSMELIKRELDFFLERNVFQVKFVDRTFNCKKSHCLEIWRYLIEHDNGVTNFHFEISADLLDEEQLSVLGQMRPGLIQLEIGVQTTNQETIKEIHRTMDLERLREAVTRIREFGNIRQHLDLIAGLPLEGFDRFCQSFDEVYHMRPHELQLGFLKVLKGSYMERQASSYDLVCGYEPPYEVLSTRWLDYGEVIRLKAVEEMVEVYYNSGQFTHTLREMETQWQSPYAMFEAIGDYYEHHGLKGISHSRQARYEILYDFLRDREPGRILRYRDLLMYDLYLRENVKSRPSFAPDQTIYKERIREFFVKERQNPRYLPGYEGYDSRQMSKMAHGEVFGDGQLVVFDYKNRDPLSRNARAILVKNSKRGLA